MTIQQENDSHNGRFYYNEDGKDLAVMTYGWRNGNMVIFHTEVDESLGGKGVGKKLVNAAVDYARKHHILIVPLCPFAKKVLEGSEQYADVLQKS